jgi:hypothetical protein
MTNYQYRKYEGAPHSEKKKAAPAEPSKLSPRGKSKKRKDVVFTNLYQLRKDKGGWYDTMFIVHVGRNIGVWGSYHAGEHVVRRMKANILRDTRTRVCWVESQITGPVSPEFHDFENLMNWLIFKGLHEGWVYATGETVTSWRTGKEKRVTRLACR